MGATLLQIFEWTLDLFAVMLLVTGVRMLRHRNDHGDPENYRVLKLFRRFVTTTDDGRRTPTTGSSS